MDITAGAGKKTNLPLTNNMKLTQRERIINRLNYCGQVNTLWAVQHNIFRLSERIRELQADEWKFDKTYGKTKKTRRIFYYFSV